jgi:hypothetical protein
VSGGVAKWPQVLGLQRLDTRFETLQSSSSAGCTGCSFPAQYALSHSSNEAPFGEGRNCVAVTVWLD